MQEKRYHQAWVWLQVAISSRNWSITKLDRSRGRQSVVGARAAYLGCGNVAILVLVKNFERFLQFILRVRVLRGTAPVTTSSRQQNSIDANCHLASISLTNIHVKKWCKSDTANVLSAKRASVTTWFTPVT